MKPGPQQAEADAGELRSIGRYAIANEIASGGMATVHLGRLLGTGGFSRTVAIKRLHPQFAKSPEVVETFLDEARLSARIRHPNVVPMLDVVATDGELFLVMEYVAGESLSRLVRAARTRGEFIPPPIATSIVAGALHGLHAAHDAKSDDGEELGIIHRDVSPHNVLVGTDGIARVLDFGVAKAAGRLQATRPGQLKGKLSYMAPEQVMSAEVSRRTDVYSAAVVLWEALTGERLFVGDNDASLLTQVLTGVVEAPSRKAPHVSPELDLLVLCGLERDPNRRFATARDFAHALEEEFGTASARQVADWVAATAGDALEERARVVSSLERTPTAAPPPPWSASMQVLDPGARESQVTMSEEIALPLRRSLVVPLATAPASADPDARSGGGPWLTAAGMLIGIGMAIWFVFRAGTPAPHESPTHRPPTPASFVTATATATATTTATTTTTATAATTASPTPTTNANVPMRTTLSSPSTPLRASAPPRRPGRSAPSVAHPAASATAEPPRVNCDPPKWMDTDGIWHLKPECM